MTAVLFVGPTLYGLTDRIPDAIKCRPPAAAGDILRAVTEGATRIGLVDGVFGNCRSVWHKEIVFALSRGVTILGAASMGALRAAECASLGMVPVGGIALEYLHAQRVADSDVALLHGPGEFGFPPLSVALVDAEDRIEGWRREGRATGTEAAGLLFAARSLHFSQRTWESVFQAAGTDTRSTTKMVSLSGISRKASDAMQLVALLATQARPVPRVEAILTKHLSALMKDAETGF